MKFRKMSKGVIVITIIFTVAVCGCFFVTGAYAAPSADNKEKSLMLNSAPNADKWEDKQEQWEHEQEQWDKYNSPNITYIDKVVEFE